MAVFHRVRSKALDLDLITDGQICDERFHVHGWAEMDVQGVAVLGRDYEMGAQQGPTRCVLARTSRYLRQFPSKRDNVRLDHPLSDAHRIAHAALCPGGVGRHPASDRQGVRCTIHRPFHRVALPLSV